MDLAFIKDRGEVCREWNTPAECTRVTCSKKHICNVRIGPVKYCKQGHRAAPPAEGADVIVIVTFYSYAGLA